MAFRTQKISQMTPKGANLEATDLIEVSTIESGSYVTRSITGQEIIDAAVGNVDWGDIGGTLSAQTDLQNALDAKVPTSRTLTINGVTQDLSADRTFTISTGITIGSTGITSGVVGRVLFEGAGNVVQESSSLFWDEFYGRLELTTTNLTTSCLLIKNSTTSNELTLRAANTDSWIGFNNRLFFLSSTTLTINQSGNVGIGLSNPTTKFQVATGTVALNSTSGNTLIGTTTDAGFRLDVNGTARVQGNTQIGSRLTIGTSGTSFGTYIETTGGGGFMNIVNGTSGGFTMTFTNSNAERMRIASTGNVLINTTTDAGFRLDVNGTARVNQTLRVNGSGTAQLINLAGNGIILNHSTGYIFQSSNSSNMLTILNGFVGVNSITDIPSAILAADSTTRGFLPPRMTSTQRNAIASPAAGLMVYDTTLNVIMYYNGTMWI